SRTSQLLPSAPPFRSGRRAPGCWLIPPQAASTKHAPHAAPRACGRHPLSTLPPCPLSPTRPKPTPNQIQLLRFRFFSCVTITAAPVFPTLADRYAVPELHLKRQPGPVEGEGSMKGTNILAKLSYVLALLCLLAIVLPLPPPAAAQSSGNLLVNPSFEEPAVPP